MNKVNKKRIENLEKAVSAKRNRPKYAKVCHNPSLQNFDSEVHQIDAGVLLILPDNGRRFKEGFCLQKKNSYAVHYG